MDNTQQRRPLWQLLALVSTPEQLAGLSCEECFSLFEFLADEAYQDQENPLVRKRIQEHFNFCPDCRIYYHERLEALESGLATLKTGKDGSS